MDTTKEFTHISLCAGYGGIDIGLKRAIGNMRTIAYSEIEAFPIANMVAKMEAGLMDAAPIWSNLKTFPWYEFRDKVDILSGGFPCQPFSAAGKGNADDDPRHLFPYIVHGIRAARPAIVFLENVEGIVSAKLKGENWNDPAGTPVLLHVLRELERLGYKATAVATSASEVGAPHQRNRWFIIGVADSDSSGGWQDKLRSELRTVGIEQPSGGTWLYSEQGEEREITFWPSRPGEPQHEWEPPRTVGNTEHNGPHGVKVAGSSETSSSDNTKGQNKTGESARTSRSGELRNIQDSELEYAGEAKQQGLPQSEGREQNIEVGQSSRNGQTKPSMGGNPNGSADWVGNAELYNSCDNRTDELRMLGNGVVPASAELAFKLGIKELLK